jgi:MtN3 and saliva related transmembrane protein
LNWLTAHTNAIGFWAGLLTTAAFVPQVIRTWQPGGHSLSWTMLALFGMGVGLWLIYGLLLGSTPIIMANSATLVQVMIIFALKTWHPNPAHREKTQPPAQQ